MDGFRFQLDLVVNARRDDEVVVLRRVCRSTFLPMFSLVLVQVIDLTSELLRTDPELSRLRTHQYERVWASETFVFAHLGQRLGAAVVSKEFRSLIAPQLKVLQLVRNLTGQVFGQGRWV